MPKNLEPQRPHPHWPRNNRPQRSLPLLEGDPERTDAPSTLYCPHQRQSRQPAPIPHTVPKLDTPPWQVVSAGQPLPEHLQGLQASSIEERKFPLAFDDGVPEPRLLSASRINSGALHPSRFMGRLQKLAIMAVMFGRPVVATPCNLLALGWRRCSLLIAL